MSLSSLLNRSYFENHPLTDIVGKPLLGLVYSKDDLSDATLIPIPEEIAFNEILSSATNLYPSSLLTPFNKFGLPLSSSQFVVLLKGEGEILYQSFAQTSMTVDEYKPHLIALLHLWNKYSLKEIAPIVKRSIERLITLLIQENNEFWGSMNDDLSVSFNKRMFKVEDIKVTKDNEGKVESLQKHIATIDESKKLEEKNYLEDIAEYNMKRRKYVDISEFLLSPLPIEKYYTVFTRSDYRLIFQSASLLESNTTLLRLFAATCCSYRFYHLVLSPDILDMVNRTNEILLISLYTRYLLYLMYKEETIYKSHSKPEHRHMTSRSVSHRIRLILYDPIFPAKSAKTFPLIPHGRGVVLGRELFSYDETIRRLWLFTGHTLKYLLSARSAPIYITGSIMTAASVRVPRQLSSRELKTASFDEDKDIEWFASTYRNSDIDVMVYVGNDKKDTLLETVEAIVDSMKKDGYTPIVEKVSNRYKIVLEGSKLELFPIYYHPMSIVYNFHVPGVRCYYDVANSTIYDFPSFTYAALTGICLDYRYFASTTTHVDIINKNAARGFVFLLNKYERRVIVLAISGLDIDVGGQRQVIRERYKHYSWNAALNHDKLEKIGALITGVMHKHPIPLRHILDYSRSLSLHGLSTRGFWVSKNSHISIPRYPEPPVRKSRVRQGIFQLLPKDILTIINEGHYPPSQTITQRILQAYILTDGILTWKSYADPNVIEMNVPLLKGYKGYYITIRFPRRVYPRSLFFIWNGLSSGISEEAWDRMNADERGNAKEIMDTLRIPKDGGIRMWVISKEKETLALDIS